MQAFPIYILRYFKTFLMLMCLFSHYKTQRKNSKIKCSGKFRNERIQKFCVLKKIEGYHFRIFNQKKYEGATFLIIYILKRKFQTNNFCEKESKEFILQSFKKFFRQTLVFMLKSTPREKFLLFRIFLFISGEDLSTRQ